MKKLFITAVAVFSFGVLSAKENIREISNDKANSNATFVSPSVGSAESNVPKKDKKTAVNSAASKSDQGKTSQKPKPKPYNPSGNKGGRCLSCFF